MRRYRDISPRPKAEISGVQKPLRSTADTVPFIITVPVYVFKPINVSVPALTSMETLFATTSLFSIERTNVTVPPYKAPDVIIPALPLTALTVPFVAPEMVHQ